MNAEALAEWVPARMYWDGGRPMVDWCHLGAARFTEPFFDETVERRLAHPFACLFRHQTPAADLAALRRERPGLAPTGFIFHMSRCGSTLAAQMLAASPRNVVLSEPGPVDWVLRARRRHPEAGDTERRAWLQGVISALGQRRTAGETRLFVKLDAWHMTEFPLIRAAFPDVPWVFLHRDPVEVVVSHERMRGAQMVPGAFLGPPAGLDLAQAAAMPFEAYAAHILAWICGAALRHAARGGRFIAYRDLPRAGLSALLAHCGVECAPDEFERMVGAARFDAKRRGVPFEEDGPAKREQASPEVLRAVEGRLRALSARMDAAAGEGCPA